MNSNFPGEPPATLSALLRRRAEQQPNQRGYTFLIDGEAQAAHLTYAELDRQARAIAALLQAEAPQGERVLLLYPPGLEYIAAFFGCLYAGMVAVPAYPPDPARWERSLARLRAIMADARPAIALTTEAIMPLAQALAAQDADLQRLRWLATDTTADGMEEGWQAPEIQGATLAFLQYTSGSTAAPKGVMLTHANLLHNSALIHSAFAHSPESRGVIWLPPYHDMGLIGGIIQPLYAGFPVVLMSPLAFLERPLRWLQAVSTYQATTSGGPNFAYDLCVRKTTPEQRAALDLSSWTVAFNGAEPIRADTLDRFAAAFAPAGFRREAFYPCYGLAEATLIVAGGAAQATPVVRGFLSAELDQHRVVAAGAAGARRVLVGCGQSASDQRIVIAEPDSLRPCAPGQVGEVWIAGPSVAQGYWQQPGETTCTFEARLAPGGEGPFLRSGDLGFVHDGELFITGRIKDLIIIRGRNHYPQDIEQTVERSHPSLRPGSGAAFAIEQEGEERLVVAQELERGQREPDVEAIAGAIRRAVAEQHELQVYAVALLKAGSLPKTSSGKIQRHACREAFLSGRLETLGRSIVEDDAGFAEEAEEADGLTRDALLALAPDARAPRLERYLREQVARVLHVALARIDTQQPISYMGLDSLMAVDLQHQVETDLGLAPSIVSILEGATIAQLAAQLLAELEQAAPPPAPVPAGEPAAGPQPLSHGQRALWFLQQLAPEGAAYNIACAVRIRAELDLPALRRAFQALVERHAALRTIFPAPHGEPLQQIQPGGAIAFGVEDAAGWDEAFLGARLAEEIQRPFDLVFGPPLRVQLFATGPREHVLLLTVHHIVSDFWSLAVLARELGALYRAETSGVPADLAALPLQYGDYVRAQAALLASAEGQRLWDYWRGQLAGDHVSANAHADANGHVSANGHPGAGGHSGPPAPGGHAGPPLLNLPTDRPRPPVQSYRGAARTLALGSELTQRLQALSRARGASLYVTLLAAFQTLLHRYTGQDDILVGSPTAGRGSAQLAGLVGYFVNPIVLRARIARAMPFAALLEQARGTVLGALEHQDYPFALLAERLQPERDPSRSPLFQVMFILQQSPPFGAPELPAFALGVGGARMELGGLPVESVALAQQTAQFDLTLTLAEVDGGLRAALQYNTDLFDAATSSRMLKHFQTLLEAVAARPDLGLADVPLLTAAEQEQLAAWNATATGYPRDVCIHELFAEQAARTPDAVALVFGGATSDAQRAPRRTTNGAVLSSIVHRPSSAIHLTYSELNARANRLAHYLRGLGVRPDARVGICMERSPELLVGLLGILKAGGAYVPLDPTYPAERVSFMLEDSGAEIVIVASNTSSDKEIRRQGDKESLDLRVSPSAALLVSRTVVDLRADWPAIANMPAENPARLGSADNLAYVIYTSGSTGRPKGVMLPHRTVVNCFVGMDQRIGCDAADRLLAVTSVSFDISVLELFWTLTRGACLVLLGEQAINRATSAPTTPRATRPLEFSLFYFASADAQSPTSADNYRLVFEGARFADAHGFSAVWTPERHFHAFGGLYPNPSVMSAALAMVTQRVRLRAGSVVLPLHSPIRVAEEWSLVDNLSRGRVGIAFASGWHSDDFAFFPEHYADRKNVMYQNIVTVQRLWRGEAVEVRGGAGNQIAVQILPRPVQPELPIWITAAGSPETFVRAGEIGANVLTHLLGQNLDEVAENIRRYREARAQHGHDPRAGHVTLMLHTFIGEDHDAVREQVRAPFTNYLRSSVGLIENMIKSMNLPLDLKTMKPQDLDDLLAFAFDRYFETSALFGTLETALPIIERVKAIDVDEVACLIDFGVEVDAVLASLQHLNALRERTHAPALAEDQALPAQAARQRPTLMQCTPSLMRMLLLNPATAPALRSLHTLLLGGEALAPDLAAQVTQALPARVINMYGPTETTIWSATHALDGGAVAIGRPIANTQIHILDRYLQPAPVGIAGELYIGGEGLARGYFERPDLTAARFIPNPFPKGSGVRDQGSDRKNPDSDPRPLAPDPRLYRTGDLARYLADGTLEFLGRVDQQVKLRGFRIELEEIEAVLGAHPGVRAAVVAAWPDGSGDQRLIGYVVLTEVTGNRLQGTGDRKQENTEADTASLSPVTYHLSPTELRDFLKQSLPDYMVPAGFVTLEALPLTANGKVDRKALPAPEGLQRSASAEYVAPRNNLEQVIAGIWQRALKLDHVGVHDNFFDLGGHSLLMAQVHSQLLEVLQRDLPLIKLLEHPTISSLSKYLSQEQAEQPSFQQSQDRARKQRESRENLRQRAQMRYKPR